MKNIIGTITVSIILASFLFSCGAKDPEQSSSNSNTGQADSKQYTLSKKKNSPKKKASTVPPEQLAKAKEIIAAVSEEDVNAVEAKRLFKVSCSTCHGTTGNLKANGATDLTKSDISLDDSVAQIYFGKGLMLPYKGTFSEAEIVALAKYAGSLGK